MNCKPAEEPVMKHKPKPVVLITAGDPLGIGPEVTVKALQNPAVQAACTPVVLGDCAALEAAGFTPDLADLLPVEMPGAPALKKTLKREPTRWGGQVSYKALETACKLAEQGRAGAVVTAPVSKQSWTLARVPYTGHTEFLRAHCGPTALMMFVSGPVRCALVSEHFAIKDLHKIITRERIEHTAQDFIRALKALGVKNPHIALSSLNPHGSDNGKFGHEETQTIIPAVAGLRKKKLRAEGPYPVDSLWVAHYKGQFDGLLCMYHDQALLGLKLAAREPIVHVTAGLDFLRTSPAHGTAFDIAGKNKADASGMTAAILFAAKHAH